MAILRETGEVDVGDATGLLATGRSVIQADELGPTPLLVFSTRRGLFVVEDRCPHAARSLSDAKIRGRRVTCKGHSRQFGVDPADGSKRNEGCVRKLKSYRARVFQGRLLIAAAAQ
jgi:nitrite reductase/ring-hydroxylating ferredoxin subunit